MQHGTLLEIPVYERQTCPQHPHSPHQSRSVLVRGCLGETFCVRQHWPLGEKRWESYCGLCRKKAGCAMPAGARL